MQHELINQFVQELHSRLKKVTNPQDFPKENCRLSDITITPLPNLIKVGNGTYFVKTNDKDWAKYIWAPWCAGLFGEIFKQAKLGLISLAKLMATISGTRGEEVKSENEVAQEAEAKLIIKYNKLGEYLADRGIRANLTVNSCTGHQWEKKGQWKKIVRMIIESGEINHKTQVSEYFVLVHMAITGRGNVRLNKPIEEYAQEVGRKLQYHIYSFIHQIDGQNQIKEETKMETKTEKKESRFEKMINKARAVYKATKGTVVKATTAVGNTAVATKDFVVKHILAVRGFFKRQFNKFTGLFNRTPAPVTA